MNNVILDNVNSIVKSDDQIYFLGDFAFGDKTQIPVLREKIKCQNFFLIFGNHDQHIKKNYQDFVFNWCKDYYEFRYKKILFCNFHYPISSWNELKHNSINIYGHCHGNHTPIGRQIDVGVDCWDFKPISIDFIIDYLKDKKVQNVDHH